MFLAYWDVLFNSISKTANAKGDKDIIKMLHKIEDVPIKIKEYVANIYI